MLKPCITDIYENYKVFVIGVEAGLGVAYCNDSLCMQEAKCYDVGQDIIQAI